MTTTMAQTTSQLAEAIVMATCPRLKDMHSHKEAIDKFTTAANQRLGAYEGTSGKELIDILTDVDEYPNDNADREDKHLAYMAKVDPSKARTTLQYKKARDNLAIGQTLSEFVRGTSN